MAYQHWVFEQLAGPKKKLDLPDYSAPFGRPRQKAIFSETFKHNIKTKRYPGHSGRPTRHLLGTQWDDAPMELTGRWMDRTLVNGNTAQNLVETWQDFIRDEQRCLVRWGSIVSFIGFVESIQANWESDTEVAWKMTILVDERSTGNFPNKPRAPRSAALSAELIDASLLNTGKRLTAVESELTTDVFDALDNLFSIVAGATSQLVKLSNQFNDIQNQSISTLQRLRLALHEVKTAMTNFQDAVESANNNFALFSRQSSTDIGYGQFRSDAEMDYIINMDIAADMDRNLAIGIAGRAHTSYLARSGDSWESISTRFFGGPDKAASLRSANGIKFGNMPIAGRVYSIPKS